jgi:prepilin-type N-terminal cleavage/methylation domain-containing protein
MVMKTGRSAIQLRRPAAAAAAFTLIELVVAMAILGVVVVSLYGGITSGIRSVRMARENLRATQILIEKTEAIRLYRWEQLTNTAFISTNFSVAYDPTTNGIGGVIYSGRLSIAPAPLNVSYSNDLRLLTVQLSWTTGSLARQRQLTTYVCRTGLQNYLY